MKLWSTVYRAAIVMALVLMCVVVVCIFTPKWRNLRETHRRTVEAEAENDRIDAEINDHKNRIDRFNSDPEYVRRIARQGGRVENGEVIFKFTNSSETVRSPEP